VPGAAPPVAPEQPELIAHTIPPPPARSASASSTASAPKTIITTRATRRP
jgi:hypothetical protein